MAISGGPDIVEDGLVLHLDAADRNSYAGLGPELVTNSNLIIPDDGNYQRIERTTSIHRSISPVSSTVELGKTYQVSWKVLNLRASNTGAGLRRGGTYISGSPNLALSPGFYTSTLYNNISTGDLSLYGDSTAGVDFDLDYLSIRELPTSINNLTGNGNNGIFAAGTACPTFNGNNSGSFVFDGSNDHIGIPYSSNLWFGNANWTIDCWINPNNFTDYGIIWDHGYGTPNTLRSIVIYINQTDGLIKIAQSPNGSTNYDVSLGLTLSTNTWQHLAIVRNNNNIVGYLNGVVGNTSIPAYSLYNSTTRSHFVGIQGDFQSVTAYDGLISNLHVYKNKALTASEIQQNYNATKGRYGL
jgi:hypothetical protein